MNKRIIPSIIFASALTVGLASSAHADIIQTLAYYDSPNGYDFVTTTPPTGSTTIGTYAVAIPTGVSVTGITILGAFGNSDVPVTALSDYFLGFAGNETAVEVAQCDSASADCYSNQDANNSWSATLTAAQIATLAPAFTAGSLDFTYTWGSSPAISDPLSVFTGGTGYDPQYVYAGETTIDVSLSPEPATVLFCLSGMAGIVALRRFRKV
jgi:hypothetical protein